MEQRKILFKAKRLDNNQWAKGSLVKSPLGTQIVWWEDSIEYAPYVDPSTVCQLTGIYDKYDKEIFENDLIQDIQTKEVFAVVWNPVYACYSFLDEKRNTYAAKNFADYSSKRFLIVGNRFDRKEEK